MILDLFYLDYQSHIKIHNKLQRKTIIDQNNGVFFTIFFEIGQAPYFVFKDERDNFWMSPNLKEIVINDTTYDLQKLNGYISTDYFTLIATLQELILSKAEQYFSQFCHSDFYEIAPLKLNFTDVKHQKTMNYNFLEISAIQQN
ncbi:hypothetical protein [Flavobacterium sp.]|uniref:hypothetical protein n=1 Tax=Flavobacterium sp. TaxID=239 RepID=UPI003751562B